MEQYFGLLLESQYKCTESVEEPASTESEMNFQLSCFISQDVRYMHTGLMKVAPPPPPLSLSHLALSIVRVWRAVWRSTPPL